MSVKQKLSLFEKTGDEVVKNSIVTEVPDVQPFIVGTIIKNPNHLFILTLSIICRGKGEIFRVPEGRG